VDAPFSRNWGWALELDWAGDTGHRTNRRLMTPTPTSSARMRLFASIAEAWSMRQLQMLSFAHRQVGAHPDGRMGLPPMYPISADAIIGRSILTPLITHLGTALNDSSSYGDQSCQSGIVRRQKSSS
jgi:hypothetical protein